MYALELWYLPGLANDNQREEPCCDPIASRGLDALQVPTPKLGFRQGVSGPMRTWVGAVPRGGGGAMKPSTDL